MIIIDTISSVFFELNGVRYPRIYQPLRSGGGVGIYNIYDSRQQLIPITKFIDFTIDGQQFSTVEDTVSALLTSIYADIEGGQLQAFWGDITGNIDNQTDLINKFDIEESARIAGDQANSDAINQEIIDRTNADADLDTRLDVLEAKQTYGFYNYENTLPIQNYTSGAMALLNNGLGAFTTVQYALDGKPNIFNTTTNRLDLTGLLPSDLIQVEVFTRVVTNSNNQEMDIYLRLADGTPTVVNKFMVTSKIYKMQNKTYRVGGTVEFYVGDSIFQNNPATIYFQSDDTATVEVVSFTIKLSRQ